MNYFSFSQPVKTSGNIFVSFNVSKISAGDSLVVYMAKRSSDATNSYFARNKNAWNSYNSLNILGSGSALLTELVACNVDDPLGKTDIETDLVNNKTFPNPLNQTSKINVETANELNSCLDVKVFDLLGKIQNVPYSITGHNSLKINFLGNKPGIYLVYVETENESFTHRISYIP